MWTEIISDSLQGPYLLTSRLDGAKCLTFLEILLLSFLSEVPAVIRRQMWFQYDSAPALYANAVRECFARKFEAQRISRG